MSNKIEEIRKRLEAATTGPWDFAVFEDSRHIIYDNTYFNRHIAEVVKSGVESEQREEDNANLIANAPEYITYLLQLVETQTKALEFYAERDNYTVTIEYDIEPVLEDDGKRAREALARQSNGY